VVVPVRGDLTFFVVGAAACRIAQHLVSGVERLGEAYGGVRPAVGIRVVAFGEPAIGVADLGRGGVGIHAEGGVVVREAGYFSHG